MNSQELKDQTPVEEILQVETPETSTSPEQVTETVEEVDPQVESHVEDGEVNDSAIEEPKVHYETKTDVINRIRELAHGDEVPQKAEVDVLKTVFYKMHLAEREAQYKEYVSNGGDPEKYEVPIDKDEEAFKAEMSLIKEKRADAFKQQEKEKKDNLDKKLEIIEKIKAMCTSPEEANKSYKQFRELQQAWKEIKSVPADKANQLWRNYQLYVEQFYDLLKLNNEAREYDFKKNLELKVRLCEAAERLADEADAVSAFHQLQKLHQEFREIGPVAKELREDIWNRFKAASAVVNKRHQSHFEGLKNQEEENLKNKTALCEQVEEIAKTEVKTSGDWERLTKQIMEIQAEWKKIGFAPQKMNVKIFERFRAACDEFFNRKAEYFKNIKTKFAENAEKKRALIARAHELVDSKDWKKTSEAFMDLQKEWKEVGSTSKKLGDALWEEFLGVCNKFFEARNAATSGQYKEERENLSKKKDIIAHLKELIEKETEEVEASAHKLMDEYNQIGHVPFKDKDKLYKEYREVCDALREKFNLSFNKRTVENFKNNLKKMAESGEEMILNERVKLMRQYEIMKSEIQTYENNLGFLNSSSKNGNSLIDEMVRRAEKLKADMQVVYEKIKAIDKEREAIDSAASPVEKKSEQQE